MEKLLRLCVLMLGFYFAATFNLQAQKVEISNSKFFYAVSDKVLVLEDPTQKLTLQDILTVDNAQKFQPPTNKKLNFGYSSAAYWLRLNIEAANVGKYRWVLEFDYPLLDFITVYSQDAQGNWKAQQTGDRLPFAERAIDYRNPTIGIDLTREGLQTFYIRIQTQSASQFPIHIRVVEDLYQAKLSEQIVYGIFFGILICMLAYNILILISVRDKSYFFYLITILGNLVLFASLNGFTHQYITPGNPYWSNQLVLIGLNGLTVGIHLFALYFLDTWRYARWVYFGQVLLIGLCSLMLVSSFVVPYLLAGRLSILLSLITSVFTIIAGFVVLSKGNQAARFFLAAWLFYLTGAILLVLRNVGVLPINFITTHSIEIGNSLEVILLALALGDKYRIYRLEREKAQNELLEVQREANENLERKVEERTRQLSEANEELNQVNEELSVTLDQLTIQKNLVEQKNEDITASINYAKRIQKAFLPSRTLIKTHIPEHFVLFKPKDVVSGDFYWFEAKQDYLMMAAVDCTGHGVPGALMSMIGDSLLNEIVNVHKITTPNIILNELHDKVRTALKQKESENRDGMDLALCKVDLANRMLHFAGAKNPLYYFEQGELVVVKGDKVPIGGMQREMQRVFTNHEIPLGAPNSKTFYIFSDGYQDQFGGLEKRKFLVSGLKNLLKQIHLLPMEDQKKLLADTIADWMDKGNQEQIDDILIIGFRI